MRKLILIIGMVACCAVPINSQSGMLLLGVGGGSAAPAVSAPTIQQYKAFHLYADPGPVAVSFDATPQTGALILVMVGGSNPFNATLYTPTDNQTGGGGDASYTRQANGGITNPSTAIWSRVSGTNSGTYTVTLNCTGANVWISGWVVEVRGQAASWLDQAGGQQSEDPYTTAVAPLSNTTFATDLVVGIARTAGASTFTAGTGWSEGIEYEDDAVSIIYRTTSATGDYDPTWTLGTSRYFSASGLAIKGK
jgi:hypothetical protein